VSESEEVPGGRFVLDFRGVTVWVPPRRVLLSDVDLRVRPGEHWVIVGPNGAGKSTMLSVAGGIRHPSSGEASLLGHRLGRVDLRELRAHIGHVGAGQKLPAGKWATAHTVVLTGHTGTIQPLWDRYDDALRARAHELLDMLGCARIADREVSVCSQGERARVQIARALLAEPRLLLLDEPSAGLDLPAREDLVAALADLAAAQPSLATITVTHHLEEVPASTTHGLLLRDGGVLTSGPVGDVFTSEWMSKCFDRELRVTGVGGRWTVHAVPA
jgi:iron complex transport system ATP-binding protein